MTNDHPTPEHSFILNELSMLSEQVETKTQNPHDAMLFGMTEWFGVELGMAIKQGRMSEDELGPFLERTILIAALIAAEVRTDVYGLKNSGQTVQ